MTTTLRYCAIGFVLLVALLFPTNTPSESAVVRQVTAPTQSLAVQKSPVFETSTDDATIAINVPRNIRLLVMFRRG